MLRSDWFGGDGVVGASFAVGVVVMTDKEVAQHYVNEVLEQAALAVERLEIGEGEVSRHYGAIYAAVIRGLKR